jgi:hypothetical protein
MKVENKSNKLNFEDFFRVVDESIGLVQPITIVRDSESGLALAYIKTLSAERNFNRSNKYNYRVFLATDKQLSVNKLGYDNIFYNDSLDSVIERVSKLDFKSELKDSSRYVITCCHEGKSLLFVLDDYFYTIINTYDLDRVSSRVFSAKEVNSIYKDFQKNFSEAFSRVCDDFCGLKAEQFIIKPVNPDIEVWINGN